ncbi:pre-mRNA-splicing factor Syf2 [Arctopsyche grandis]|uniref:pre-mRNA-splicing factor Syf2 n=1 Tax=Arctopsyche grandis TaxID=121162 RepID=UPI00406D8CC1
MESGDQKMSIRQKHLALQARLAQLRTARHEARKDNHKEVVAEGARDNLPKNHEALQRRADWILKDEEQKREAAERGEDPRRAALLNVTATDAERALRSKASKNPDEGFSTYEQATIRQHKRLVKNMKVMDKDEYERCKQKYGAAFYGGADVILHGMHQDKKEAVDNMVQDLEQQISRRQKYSRRRTHNDDADIDYINERNAKFNKKLERFYGEHTAEIKQNLERGTAI